MIIDEVLEQDQLVNSELAKFHVVRGDNVWAYFAKYYISKPYRAKDYPNIAPPFSELWFEWSTENAQVAFVLTSFDLSKGINPVVSGLLTKVKFPPYFLESSRWLTSGIILMKPKVKSDIPKYLGSIAWLVDSTGALVHDVTDTAFKYIHNSALVGMNLEDARAMTISLVRNVWLMLSFMNCKNIVSVKSPPIPDALRQARERRGKPPLIRFHTLVIDPRKSPQGQRVISQGSDVGYAEHICRGHFKRFEGKGLFGRYRGTFWWPEFMRGSSEYGTVEKDYLITDVDTDPFLDEKNNS